MTSKDSTFEFKGTPGPWMLISKKTQGARVWAKDGEIQIADCDCSKALSAQVKRDNARAVSAIPRLIDALDQALTSMLDSCHSNNSVAVKACRQALNEATGGRK